MRKKFIGVYALMAVLALGTTVTSCVDDNESASVTAIRDAKAKQLESLANLNNEKATAVKIKAEAQAAIDNAKAAYEKALAEMKENEAAIAKARLEIDIEAAKAQAEANLATQKAALESAKGKLIAALDDLAAAQQTTANTIIGAMNTLLNDINKLNADIVEYTFLKTNAEFELGNNEIAKVEEENENNAEIAYQEALIKEYEKYDQAGLEAAKEAAATAAKEAEVFEKQFNELSGKYSTVSSNEWSIYSKLNETLLVKTASSYLEREDPTFNEVTIDFGDGTVASETQFIMGKLIVDEEAKAQLEEDIKNQEAYVKAATLGVAEAEKALADIKADQAYKDALAAVAAAEKKMADAKTENEVYIAQGELTAAKSALADLTASAETTLERKQNSKEYAEEYLADLNEALDCVNDTKAYEEYSKLYDEYVAANKVTFEALIAVTKADHNYQVKQSLAWNLEYVVSQTTDYASLINDCKEAINNAKKDNDALQAVSTQEDLIEFYQNKLDSLNKQLEVKDSLYSQYEAALNQVIEGEMPTIPETPAEGEGTETPAE